MNFKKYKQQVIDEFIDECISCELIDDEDDFDDEHKKIINEKLNEHQKCFDNYKFNFDKYGDEVFIPGIFADGLDSFIECEFCKDIIVKGEDVI